MTKPLFIYGTLRHPELMALIAGPGTGHSIRARLADHAVDRVADSELPMLLHRAGAVAQGDLWIDLSADQLDRLDSYETPFDYDRRPVSVVTEAGETIAADAYFPTGLISSGEAFDLGRWEQLSGVVTLLAAQEIADHAPALTAPELGRQWPMIRHRAQAKMRAASVDAAASIRHQASPDQYETLQNRGMTGGFFKYRELTVRHRRFDGQWSDPLPREVYLGVDAALVLPYDPKTDRVLMVEQFRMGPFARQDANPWTLEPIAGMVDADETPETCALRESVEEAGLSLNRLEKIASFYPSPGGSSEYFYCYLGIASLPDAETYHGGLASEHEDLRLHVLPFEQALGLVTTGEITVGPLITMLFWLAQNRDRIRASA